METNSLYFKVVKWSGEKLWNLWLKDIGNYQMFREMEVLARRSTKQIWDLKQPQKSKILYK